MYVRDKRSPTPRSETVSRVMSANRAKDTKPEILLRKALWHAGHRGYRLYHRIRIGKAIRRLLSTSNPKSEIQNPKSFVRPDISFVGKRVAIFVNGCFWHRCPKCNYALPKNNSAFWQAEFDRNNLRNPFGYCAFLRFRL